MSLRPILFFLILFVFFASRCNNDKSVLNTKKSNVPNISFTFVNSFPHDTNSFTEGFLIYKGELYESTGATESLPQTKSLFGIVDSITGKINVKVILDSEKYFGEGITFLNGKVYQLTYKTKIGFIYDATTFKKIGQFVFPGEEGWGLTTDGTNLIMSNGTNVLTVLDPINLQTIKTISVSEDGFALDNLNELEFINNFIYANVWQTNSIVKIDPKSGKVAGKLDLTQFAEESKRIFPGSLEMNGIAFDSISDKIYVTGKLWPKIYQIKFNH